MDRDKLIEVLKHCGDYNSKYDGKPLDTNKLADYLIANGIGDITALKAENERLTKQLENAVVLPKPFIEKVCHDGAHERYKVYHSTVETVCFVCDDMFDTREAAEARLKELERERCP